MLRGAFGSAFRNVACRPGCADSKTCEARDSCAYARTFEPILSGARPSGLSDPPRPFVFRAAHLDGSTIAADTDFHFDVHLFSAREPNLRYFILAFAQLARLGLGPERTSVLLENVEQLDPSGVRLRDLTAESVNLCPSILNLDALPEPVNHVRVNFVTPTELKSGQRLAIRPEFAVLFARVRDRLATLSALYGTEPLSLDFDALGARAEQVQMIRCEWKHVRVSRVSSKTGQRHPLGGFIGEAEYAGALGEFVPFLRAAQFTGVGRQTTWGKGEILVTCSM